MQSESHDDSSLNDDKTMDIKDLDLKKTFLNESEFAIQGINLNKVIKCKKYGILKQKEEFLLKNVNINITKGKM